MVYRSNVFVYVGSVSLSFSLNVKVVLKFFIFGDLDNPMDIKFNLI